MVDTFSVFYAPIMSDIIEEAIVEEGKNQYDLVIGDGWIPNISLSIGLRYSQQYPSHN